MKRWKIVAGAVVVVALATWFIASPWIAVHGMRKAMASGDSEELAEYVDFPSVRQSLKDQFNAMLMTAMAESSKDGSPFAALGMALGGVMVDRMVDSMVTPAGLAAAYEGKRQPDQRQPDRASSSEIETKTTTSMGYESFSKFVIDVESGEDKMRFVMRRDGLLGWKLTSIRLPKRALGQ